ncbi:MAG: hypothetical protein ACR2IS_13155 [Nitrososphaeraceae archaeon]
MIFPFAISSALIIQNKHVKIAYNYSQFGYYYIIASIIFLLLLNYPGFILLPDTIVVQCGKNPQKFNITNLSDCTRFIPGSLAEQCAENPKAFNIGLSECSNFLPNAHSGQQDTKSS